MTIWFCQFEKFTSNFTRSWMNTLVNDFFISLFFYFLSNSASPFQTSCPVFFLLSNGMVFKAAYQSMWHCSCPGAGCRHTRTPGLPGRPNRGYRNHHNSPGRHCHLKNKHRPKQQISTNLLSDWQDGCLCVHPFMTFSNVSPWSTEHKVLLHCPLRTNFLLFWDAGGTRGHYF